MVMYGPKKNAKVLSEWGGGAPAERKKKNEKNEKKAGKSEDFRTPPKKNTKGKKQIPFLFGPWASSS